MKNVIATTIGKNKKSERKFKNEKNEKMFTIAILIGILGSQTVYAFITEAKTYNVKSNTIVEIHTGGGRLTQTKRRDNRPRTLQLKGNPLQTGTDSLDAKIDTDFS